MVSVIAGKKVQKSEKLKNEEYGETYKCIGLFLLLSVPSAVSRPFLSSFILAFFALWREQRIPFAFFHFDSYFRLFDPVGHGHICSSLATISFGEDPIANPALFKFCKTGYKEDQGRADKEARNAVGWSWCSIKGKPWSHWYGVVFKNPGGFLYWITRPKVVVHQCGDLRSGAFGTRMLNSTVMKPTSLVWRRWILIWEV